jgi:hypothetical protein
MCKSDRYHIIKNGKNFKSTFIMINFVILYLLVPYNKSITISDDIIYIDIIKASVGLKGMTRNTYKINHTNIQFENTRPRLIIYTM